VSQCLEGRIVELNEESLEEVFYNTMGYPLLYRSKIDRPYASRSAAININSRRNREWHL
jgi:hypothetical protein